MMEMAYTTTYSLRPDLVTSCLFLGVSGTIRRKHEIALEVSAFNDQYNRPQVTETRISCPLARISE